MSVTGINKEAQKVILDCISYIYYLVQFRKDKSMIQALINSGCKVNAMTPAHITKLSFKVWRINVGAEKIDGSLLAIYRMVIAAFQALYKLGRACFFQESFLLSDTSMEVILGMPFLTFSNADIQFAEKELTWRSYITKKALLTTQRVELTDKK